ncbi:ABC transporter ATP-binding protein [Pseudofrankia inefficax]|uniref:ABC transporter related protein n=1 Tax=Pseudofrankia inefficax (strain DSM 45817 / CECT 9037 / DDB 130130 / EuI1c) TaxID=298654 RepID=E3JB86_PSEI1|nr:ABC transporter ATP-binding protein [Pseudofrankia inefficax]ADP78616.1 ABC transporter related protein [Pseudofrankia inefficax]
MSAVTATAPDGQTATAEPLLRVTDFTKRFGEVLANSDVSFDVRPGEVHALIGENGAGKSTLLKLIYGMYKPDSGELRVAGEQVAVGSPTQARALGIGMVFQDLRLVPAFTVTENYALALATSGITIRQAELRRRITEASETYGLAVDPTALVRHLSIGERQRTEILKVLMSGARIVILDEPTSVLAPTEVEALFAMVNGLRAQGLGIVIVTHKLAEVRAIADRVTVLRGGRVVLSGVDPKPMTDAELIEAMVGQTVAALPAERPTVTSDAPPALELTDVSALGDRGVTALRDVTLTVNPGEIVGVAGVAGSGQRELCEVAVGARSVSAGTVRVNGRELGRGGPTAGIAAGAVDVPEDPVNDAVVPTLTVLEHMALSHLKAFLRRIGVDWRRAGKHTTDINEKVQLRMAPAHRRVADLSGGNIQRVMLSRALGREAPLVVAAYPSRGLDIATTRRTQELLLARRAEGAGLLVVSEDLDELMAVADRIAVFCAGRLTGVVAAATTNRQELGALMTATGPATDQPADTTPAAAAASGTQTDAQTGGEQS